MILEIYIDTLTANSHLIEPDIRTFFSPIHFYPAAPLMRPLTDLQLQAGLRFKILGKPLAVGREEARASCQEWPPPNPPSTGYLPGKYNRQAVPACTTSRGIGPCPHPNFHLVLQLVCISSSLHHAPRLGIYVGVAFKTTAGQPCVSGSILQTSTTQCPRGLLQFDHSSSSSHTSMLACLQARNHYRARVSFHPRHDLSTTLPTSVS